MRLVILPCFCTVLALGFGNVKQDKRLKTALTKKKETGVYLSLSRKVLNATNPDVQFKKKSDNYHKISLVFTDRDPAGTKTYRISLVLCKHRSFQTFITFSWAMCYIFFLFLRVLCMNVVSSIT